jgi:hypothetical protein
VPAYALDANYGTRLRSVTDQADGPVYMLTMTRFRSDSGQILGQGYGQDPDSRYIPIPLLSAVGASLCFVAHVIAGSGGWERVGVIRYPTRRSFIEQVERSDTKAWSDRKRVRLENAMVLGVLPEGHLPAGRSQRVLVEVWHGPAPEPIAVGTATEFEVEGTWIGDGRQWSGARYTTIDPGTALPLGPARFGYLALLVEPIVERWI